MTRRTRLLVALIFSCFPVAMVDADARTDRERAGLIGPVRTVATTDMLPHSDMAVGSYSVTIYDPQGNEIEATISNYGVLTGKDVHTYDAQGQRTETAHYGPDGSVNSKTSYRYDPEGQLIEQKFCAVSGDCFGEKVYFYDVQGNCTEERVTNPNNSFVKLRLVHTYNAQGQREKTTIYDSHDPGFAIATYNTQGNMTEMVAYHAENSPSGNKTVFTYEFDTPGNWITQVWSGCSPRTEAREYDCAEPRRIKRTISYYPTAAP
jgi:hypothetical protein